MIPTLNIVGPIVVRAETAAAAIPVSKVDVCLRFHLQRRRRRHLVRRCVHSYNTPTPLRRGKNATFNGRPLLPKMSRFVIECVHTADRRRRRRRNSFSK